MQDVIQIRRVGKEPGDANASGRFAVPSMGIQTPQGKRLIPNPAGREVWVLESLEDAKRAVHQAGFAAEFEGQIFPPTSPAENNRSFRSAVTNSGGLHQAIPLLIERLRDLEPVVVSNAAIALGNLGATQALTDLCRPKVLSHEDSQVRKSVADALSKLGQGAIPELQKVWEQTRQRPDDNKTPYIRLTVVTACTFWAERYHELPMQLLQITLEALEDSNWLVRSQASVTVAQASAWQDLSGQAGY